MKVINGVNVYSVSEFEPRMITCLRNEKRPSGKAGAMFKQKYKKIVTAFDIETTALEDVKQSVMYVWQWHFDGIGTFVGRTWNSFVKLVCDIERCLNEGERIVAYVHWLTHEFQYLKGIYRFENDDIFAIDARSIGKCLMSNCIEFRCSYLLANQGLEGFLKDTGVTHKKLDLDYDIKRFPYTPLSESEIEYCIHDVVGLVEAVKVMMERENDTLYTIPMTSTGYIRREIKRAMHDWSHVNGDIYSVTPELMTMAFEAFRGGDTHASRFYSGVVVEGVPLYKDDISSDYPARIGMSRFPMSQFRKVDNPSKRDLYNAIVDDKAVLFRVKFYDIEIKDKSYSNPYISASKCLNPQPDAIKDNGRIMSSPCVVLSLTDVDFEIICDTYKFSPDWEVLEMYTSKYGYLPKNLTDIFIKYYKIKTSLKGVAGEEGAYDMGKRKFNAGYGCMVQNPLHEGVKYDPDTRKFNDAETTLEEAVRVYQRKAFLSYFWGVWTTAHARYHLHVARELVGHRYVIYWDTDSLVHCNPDPHVLDVYNKLRRDEAEKAGFLAVDRKGNTHYAGVFERETHVISKFKTYGSKKYITEYEDGEVEITISGVSKKKGSAEIVEKGGIRNWNPTTVFENSGNRSFWYNDNVQMSYETPDGRELLITDNVYSEDTVYQMSIKPEYQEVLHNARTLRRIYEQMNKHILQKK